MPNYIGVRQAMVLRILKEGGKLSDNEVIKEWESRTGHEYRGTLSLTRLLIEGLISVSWESKHKIVTLVEAGETFIRSRQSVYQITDLGREALDHFRPLRKGEELKPSRFHLAILQALTSFKPGAHVSRELIRSEFNKIVRATLPWWQRGSTISTDFDDLFDPLVELSDAGLLDERSGPDGLLYWTLTEKGRNALSEAQAEQAKATVQRRGFLRRFFAKPLSA